MCYAAKKWLKLRRPNSVEIVPNKSRMKTAIALVLMLLFSLILLINVKAGVTVLSVEPRSTTLWGTGGTLTINITVVEVNDLYGWQAKLYYNSAVLNGTRIIEGSFLKSSGSTFFNYTFDDNFEPNRGRLTAFGSLVGNVSGVKGAGVLATITFKAKAIGNSLLDIENTVLGNIDSVPISHEVVDGAVQVVEAIYDVAIESLVAVPKKVVDGQSVNIYVIAANRGNRTETFYVATYYNQTVIDTRMVNNLLPGTTTSITFVWNTTGVTPNATCTIWAEASTVPEETNLQNNVYVDGFVEVVMGIHDIAVPNVSCSSQSIYKGGIVNIYVTVKNEGNYTETFDLTVYGNDTAIETKKVNLQYGAMKYVTFAWNTTYAETNATYLLKAIAASVPGEQNSSNNLRTDGYVKIYPPGLFKIEMVELTPCDELGRAKTSFASGTTAYFKITVQGTSFEAEQVLLTINLYDSRKTAIGVVSFNGPIGSGTTILVPGFPIPKTASLGTATVYVNILTDWPHLGGRPYCPEAYKTFEVVGS